MNEDNPCYELIFVNGEPKTVNRIDQMIVERRDNYIKNTGDFGDLVIYVGRHQRRALIDYADQCFMTRCDMLGRERMRFMDMEVFTVDAKDHLAVRPAP
jgi:hypothetical protein